jgi:maltose O-acetyltransferase
MGTQYESNVKNRSLVKFYIGILARFKKHWEYSIARKISRKKGASIGSDTIISMKFSKLTNNNLQIGNHCSIQTEKIDLRSSVKIGNNIIIGFNTEIITTSHNIDSIEWEGKYYGIQIEDYVWIATNVLILPSCRKIGYGAVIGSGSVVVKNVEPMTVVSGNPAISIKVRENVHSNLVIESLLGGDLITYFKSN